MATIRRGSLGQLNMSNNVDKENGTDSVGPLKRPREKQSRRQSVSIIKSRSSYSGLEDVTNTPGRRQKKAKADKKAHNRRLSRVSFGVVDVRVFEKNRDVSHTTDLGTIKFEANASPEAQTAATDAQAVSLTNLVDSYDSQPQQQAAQQADTEEVSMDMTSVVGSIQSKSPGPFPEVEEQENLGSDANTMDILEHARQNHGMSRATPKHRESLGDMAAIFGAAEEEEEEEEVEEEDQTGDVSVSSEFAAAAKSSRFSLGTAALAQFMSSPQEDSADQEAHVNPTNLSDIRETPNGEISFQSSIMSAKQAPSSALSIPPPQSDAVDHTEVTMEFTGAVPMLNQSVADSVTNTAELKPATFNSAFQAIMDTTKSPHPNKPSDVMPATPASVAEQQETDLEEMSMDMTRAVGNILTQSVTKASSPAASSSSEAVNEAAVAPPGSDIAKHFPADTTEVTMEMTQAVGLIMQQQAEDEAEEEQEQQQEEPETAQEAQTMELTTAHGRILATAEPQESPMPKQANEEEVSMEFTKAHGAILSSARKQEEKTNITEVTMDMTGAHGGILSADAPVAAAQSQPDMSEATMDFTEAHGTLLQPKSPATQKKERLSSAQDMLAQIKARMSIGSVGSDTGDVVNKFAKIIDGGGEDRTADLPKLFELGGATMDVGRRIAAELGIEIQQDEEEEEEEEKQAEKDSVMEMEEVNDKENVEPESMPEPAAVEPEEKSTTAPPVDAKPAELMTFQTLFENAEIKSGPWHNAEQDADSNDTAPWPPADLAQRIQAGMVDYVEFEDLSAACEQMQDIVESSNSEYKQMEKDVNHLNAHEVVPLFAAAQENAEAMKGPLQRLFRQGELHAQMTINEYTQKMQQGTLERLTTQQRHLETDAEALNLLAERAERQKQVQASLNDPTLCSLREAIAEQMDAISQFSEGLHEMEQRKEALEHELSAITERQTIVENHVNDVVSTNTELAAVKATFTETQDAFSLLGLAVQWRPASLTADQMSLVFNGTFLLSIDWDTNNNSDEENKTPVANASVVLTHTGLQNAVVKAMFNQASTQGDLTRAITAFKNGYTFESRVETVQRLVAAVEVPMGRILSVQKELAALQKDIFFNTKIQSDGTFRVWCTGLAKRAQVVVDFRLTAAYPMTPLDFQCHVVSGDVTEQSVANVVNMTTGFGRLTKICKTLRAMMQ